MKDNILKVLEESNYAIEAGEIADKLKIKDITKFKEMLHILDEAESEALVYRSNKNKYLILKNSHLKKGKLLLNQKGFGFVIIEDEEEDIYVNAHNINGAVNNDVVLVEIVSKKLEQKREGRILRVVNRDLKQLVGEFYKNEDRSFVKLDDKKIKLNIEIKEGNENGAVEGSKVIVKTLKQLNNNSYLGEVEEVIGHKDDPGVDILSIVYKHDISTDFPKEVVSEAAEITSEVTKEDIGTRRDLRDKLIYTIDGADAKDLDDAVRVEQLENGNYLLGVYIADVSYYVKENSKVDEEASERGTSVYLVDRVIPMLPHSLSNGICSLNGNVDRLAMACEMEIDHRGNVVNSEIFETVINSKKRMTYKAVNDILEDNVTPEGYEPFVKNIRLAKKVADILRESKVRRGYIEFETDEVKILVDELGKPTEIKKRYRGSGEKLVEDFMIAANETVADFIFHMDLPFVYRIHEKPKEEKINQFLAFVSQLGYRIVGKKNNFTSKSIQNILDQLTDKKEYPIFADLLLRSMQKAVYSPDNVGHYGLGSKCYTHFTSPIRRYPDTTVHRLLRTYLVEGNISTRTTSYWKSKVVQISEHSSTKERAAVSAEREVSDMKKAEYMVEHIGEEFSGMISSVMGFGMFVKLENLIEGLVHITELGDDYYVYDERSLSLVGERKKRRFRIGDNVKIKVIGANKEEGKIDFKLVIDEKDEKNAKKRKFK